MGALHTIGNSHHSPWEPSDLQFFILRTAGNEMTTLVETAKEANAHLEMFPMGYTNLWIVRRVGLYLPTGMDIRYPDPPFHSRYGGSVGRYFFWGDKGSHVAWIQVGDKMELGFPDLASAEVYLKVHQKEGEKYVIGLCVEDHMWH
jgi:hypothetical protein